MFPAPSARGPALVRPWGPAQHARSLLLGATGNRRSCPQQLPPGLLASPKNNKTYILKHSSTVRGTVTVLSKYLLHESQ